MSGEERRRALTAELAAAAAPVAGAELARRLGVSRQVIVQDVALLRSRGTQVLSTNRGYVLAPAPAAAPARPRRVFKTCHTAEQTRDELTCIVDLGARVEDVQVNHRAYGRLRAPLGIASRRDVDAFIHDIETGKSSPLMTVTSGYHFHTVSADAEEILDEVAAALAARGYLAKLMPYEQAEFGAA